MRNQEINILYNHLRKQFLQGEIVLTPSLGFNLNKLLNKLEIEKLILVNLEITPLYLDETFKITGSMIIDQKIYKCILKVLYINNSVEYEFNSELIISNIVSLLDLYPPALARVCWNYYSTPIPLFKGIGVKKACMQTVTYEENEILFNLNTIYTEDSLFYQYFSDFIPNPGEILFWKGSIKHPFGESKYQIRVSYDKNIIIPITTELLIGNIVDLELISHKKDIYNLANKQGDGSCCSLKLNIKLFIKLFSTHKVLASIDLLNVGVRMRADICFDKQNIVDGNYIGLIKAFTGVNTIKNIPEWLPLDNLLLQQMTLVIENGPTAFISGAMRNSIKEIPSDRTLVGCIFYFDIKMSFFPIPSLLNSTNENTRALLMIEINLSNGKGIQQLVISFKSYWKNYELILNTIIPGFYFKGRLIHTRDSNYSQPIKSLAIFSGMQIKDIMIEGELSTQKYCISLFLQQKDSFLKIGSQNFIIESIKGELEYAPEGLFISVGLNFTFLENTSFILWGNYEFISNDEQILAIGGRIDEEIKLSSLISQIIGNKDTMNDSDLIIKSLHLLYRTKCSSDPKGMLGDPQEFSFNCAIAYDWGTGEIATTFIMHWVPDVYSYNMAASLKVLDFLLLSASCSVDFSEGEMQFQNFAFLAKLGKAQITATFDKDKNYAFKIQDFNLGELLEELIRLIDNDHDWYLPWPYTILKELSIKELEIIINNSDKTLKARYYTNFKILFLTVQYVELFYDMANGDFFVNVQVNGSISRNNDDLNGEKLGLNLLKDKFPALKEIGEKPLHISYLAIGQHIKVDLPETFDGQHFSEIFAEIKKSVTKGGAPTLDATNNWIAALQFKLLKAIDVTLLMCDPVFYGVEIAIGKGFEMTDPLNGLKVTILYSKVTDTIGMFYARLNFPEVFRKINLGAVQITLGEVAIAIYTNGNFKIDLGFPWEKDFGRSFGLVYMYFTGQGGFYLGVLNGDTSKQLPAISRGHFGSVVELGIGINAGIGLEINAGPLKAGAYVKLVAIFQGVFASYMSEEGDNTTYYKIQATAGVTASIYGSIDFVLIQIGFSINASVLADLTIERYRQTELALALDVSVNAYIKILFIKIKFDFHFHWTHKFLLGNNEIAPWEVANALLLTDMSEYELEWNQQQVLSQKHTIPVEIVPFFTYDGVVPGQEKSGEGRIAFLALLHGYETQTRNLLGYTSVSESPFGIILQAVFLRTLYSVKVDGKVAEEVTPALLSWLEEQLEQITSFHTGFGMDMMNEFLENNLELSYRKGENNYEDQLIEGIPFPLSPYLCMEWYSNPNSTLVYELDKEPATDYEFINRLQKYYTQLAVDTDRRLCAFRNRAEMETAGGFLFSQYFYMLSRIAVHVVKENFPVETSTLDFQAATDLLLQENAIHTASGMTSRFQYGGSRVVTDTGRDSLYSFACQQFKGLTKGNPDDLWHKMVMTAVKETPPWMKLDVTSATWEFYEKDMDYPEGALQAFQPQLMPYYRQKEQTLELKNPNGVSGNENMTFLEAETVLPNKCRFVLRSGDNEHEVVCKKGILLYLSLTKAGNGIYRINTIGYDGIEKLNRLGKVTGIDIYRTTTAFDEDRKGFYPVDKEVFLYRTNLCLEAEKPELKLLARNAEYKNSALLEESLKFLGLLKDASLVNSKGYFIRMGTEQEPVNLPEGCDSLVVWIETEEKPDAVLLLEAYNRETQKPLVYTGATYGIPVFQPGTLAFTTEMHPTGAEDSIENLFQMLDYCIEENEFFDQSHESTPLFAEHKESGEVYSQIVPVYRLAKDGSDSPYGGIQEGSKVSLAFSYIDILGNKSTKAATLEIPVGYTDTLVSPVVWPHTRCVYTVEQSNNGWNFIITFSWTDNENELPLGNGDDKKLIESAFWQMNCRDIQAKVILWNKEYEVDPQLLKQYIADLRDGKKPADVAYQIKVEQTFSEEKEIDLSFGIFRNQNLVDASIHGSREEKNVKEAVVKVKEDCEATAKPYLARCGQNGNLFMLEYPPLALSDPEYFTLPPLYNQLVSLPETTVWQMDGSEASTNFYNIDMEVWADLFLSDLEGFLQPKSPYSYSRDTLEGLLAAKKILAGNIAAGACMIYEKPTTRNERAIEFYKNELLKDLYQGRKYDVCIIAKASSSPEVNKAYILSTKIDDGNYTVKSGKIRSDGLVEIGLHAKDITRKAEDNVLLEYSISDKEICRDGNYEYLTWQKCQCANIELKVPLLYKRFPQTPILISQGYQTTEKLFGWKYNLQFSQETPAQDIVTLRLITNRLSMQNKQEWQLPIALARYMYLRDKFLQPSTDIATYGEMLVKVSQAIAETWSYKLQSNYLCNSRQKVMFVHRDPALGILHVDSEQITPDNIEIAIKMEDGSFSILNRNNNEFRLPETGYITPPIYEFTVDGFDIREDQQINALLSVTRNQLSKEIAPIFVYETEKVSFTQSLLPTISKTDTILMGNFEAENFVTELTKIISTFTRLRMEMYCAIPVSRHNEQILYSYVPISFIPMTSTENLKDLLHEVYLDIQNFLKENEPEAQEKIQIRVALSLVNGQDESRNIVDFRSLSFTM